jgi:hypothetical protein
MKQWFSEARNGDSEGLAWLAWDDNQLVGWAAVVDGEISVYIKPSERRRGIGLWIMTAIGNVSGLSARPHDRAGRRFFERHGVPFDDLVL